MRVKLAFLLVLFLLTSCAAGGTATSAPPTSIPQPSATPLPTVGPTPTLPAPLVVLVLPADMDAAHSKDYQTAVYEMARSSGFRFQVLNKFTLDDLKLVSNLKVVIAVPPDPGFAGLSTAAPQTQFLAVNIPDVKPGGNVSVLGGESLPTDKVAFMAGYIAAMVTGDFFQTGAILRKDTPESPIIKTAFEAGRTYYCGICRPLGWYTPFEYPAFVEIPSDAKPNEYNAYSDILVLQKKVGTIFLQSGIDTPDLIKYLSTVGILAMGTQTPAKSYSNWVVTLQPDYLVALKSAWPELVAGQGGRVFSAPLSLTDANPELFSLGKQRLAQTTLNDLLAGLISTNVNP